MLSYNPYITGFHISSPKTTQPNKVPFFGGTSLVVESSQLPLTWSYNVHRVAPDLPEWVKGGGGGH